MSRETPGKTFIEAQAAIKRGDWDGFFACFHTKDLMRIASNGVKHLLLMSETSAEEFCGLHDIPKTAFMALRSLSQRMEESGRMHPLPNKSSPEDVLKYSLQHKQIVDEYQKSEKSVLKAIQDIPRFTAALERHSRATFNGGSISLSLFVDEVLEDILVENNKAYATRRTARGYSEDIGFIRIKGEWYIRLFAKRPLK